MYNCMIVGAGRSGTSTVAGILNNEHYFFGRNLIPPRDANPKGFFEDASINREINEQILRDLLPRHTLGQRWLGRVPLNAKLRINSAIETRIRNALSTEPFCYKDPRFCYTLPIWNAQIDQETTRYICVFRHPKSTIQSVMTSCKKDAYLRSLNMTPEQSEKIWYKMYKHVVEKHVNTGTWHFVHYDQLFEHAHREILRAFLRTPCVNHKFPEKKLRKIISIRYTISKRTKAMYQSLCKLAGV